MSGMAPVLKGRTAPVTGSSLTSGCTAVPLTELKFPPANRFTPSVVSAHTSVGLLLLCCVVPATLATKLFRRLPLARQYVLRLAGATDCPVGETAFLKVPPT